MSSGLRRPATRDAHTKYFIVLADMNRASGSPSPYPSFIDWVARTDGAGTVTSVMSDNDFLNATSDFATFQFDFPTPVASRSILKAGDILKDLGSVVHIYDQLGSPNPIHFSTYRRVQLVAGGDNTNPDAAHISSGLYSEGPWKEIPPTVQNNTTYNTFWIRTWTANPQWFRTASIARLG
jgi:hypothetical protein